jgi:hypothetical protein
MRIGLRNSFASRAEMRRPLKDKLLLQGLSRGNFNSEEGPHSYTSFLAGVLPKKVTTKLRTDRERSGPDRYSRGNCISGPAKMNLKKGRA